MATYKHKLEPYDGYKQHYSPPGEEGGCGTYTVTAIQYALVGPDALMKLLIGGALTLIPVIGSWFVAGYSLRAIRRVMRGDYTLPEWDDFGGDFIRGLIMSIGMFIFAMLMSLSMVLVITVPFILIFGVPMTAYVVARFAATDDFAAFVDLLGAARAILAQPVEAFVLAVSSYVVIFVMSLLIGVGSVLFVIPGLMMAFALGLALTFNAAIYGRTVLDS